MIKKKVLCRFDSVPLFFSLKTSKHDMRTQTSILGRLQNSRLVHLLKGIAYAKLFEKYSPDEIHAHFLSDSSNIAMVAAMCMNVPFSISAHAKDVFVEPSLAKVKVQNAKFITVCNRFAFERCLELAAGIRSKIYLNYHGIDYSTLFSNAPLMQKPTRPVLFPGATRLVEKKGLIYLLEASKILKDRGIDHEVHIVGPNDPKDLTNRYEQFKQKAIELGIGENVKFFGDGKGMPFSKLAGHYKIADIFVLPAISTNEGDVDGIPNTLIEAAIAKIPIVTTNTGSIRELIKHHETGTIVKQADPYELATAIERILFDKDTAKKLAENAFTKAVEMFDIDKNIAKFEEHLLSNG